MAVPTTWKSKDDLPEWTAPLIENGDIVANDDGTYALQVEGMRPKEDVDEFRTRNTQLQKDLEALRASMHGGLSKEEAVKQLAKIQVLQDRLEAGEHDDRVKELVEKRLVTVTVGDQEISVDRTSKAALEASMKKLADTATASQDSLGVVSSLLTTERMHGGTYTAMSAIGGFREAAHDDVVRYIDGKFIMGADYIPFLPDPEGEKPESGELPAALMGEDGKPVSIESHLLSVREGGKKNDVWFEGPVGPKRVPKPGHETKPGEVHGADRIAKGIAKRRSMS